MQQLRRIVQRVVKAYSSGGDDASYDTAFAAI